MQNKLLARALATMMAATAAVGTASVPMMIAPIVAMAAETPTATIQVKNVEAGATVKAYQLVKGVYDTAGKLTKYEMTTLASGVNYDGHAVSVDDLVVYSATAQTGTTQDDTTDKLAAWTAEVAKQITQGTTADKTLTSTGDSTYSATAEPGLYLVLITKEGTTSTYNPILLAVNVSDADNVSTNITGSEVDLATARFKNGSTEAYAKKTTNGLTKSIVVADGASTKDVKGVSAAVGDTINFKLADMNLPSYSAQYTNPQYVITDTLEANCFGGITDLTVKVDGQAVEAGEGTYTLTNADGTAFIAGTSTDYKITFASAYLTAANAGKSVEITYSATVASTATQNFAENYNHAQLEYNYIKTDLTQDTKTLTDNVYVYNLGVDTFVDSEGTGTARIMADYTLNKVTKTGGTDNFEDSSDSTIQTMKSKDSLEGAEFQLYTTADCTTVAKYNENGAAVESDSKGHLTFTGLGEGTYYLKETKAPSGYTVNSTIYQITVSATIAETTGYMSQYSFVVKASTDNYATEVGHWTTTATTPTVNEDGSLSYTIDRDYVPVEILNTVLQQLPFTGGEGRYAIYIGSVALAALVVILLIVKRRRDEQEQ